MPEYLIRCAQLHESFRKAELESLATLAGVDLEFISYDDSVGLLLNVPFFPFLFQSFSQTSRSRASLFLVKKSLIPLSLSPFRHTPHYQLNYSLHE